jgi:hypothetical protein
VSGNKDTENYRIKSCVPRIRDLNFHYDESSDFGVVFNKTKTLNCLNKWMSLKLADNPLIITYTHTHTHTHTHAHTHTRTHTHAHTHTHTHTQLPDCESAAHRRLFMYFYTFLLCVRCSSVLSLFTKYLRPIILGRPCQSVCHVFCEGTQPVQPGSVFMRW